MIEQERDGAWLTLALNRPEARNALSLELVEQLLGCLHDARGDASVRGITLCGRGGVFCAGGDIKMFRKLFQGDTDRDAVMASSRKAGVLFDRLATMPQPVIALVEGAAMAGGLGLACAADIVVTTRDARFALTETTLGITPAQVAPYVIRRAGVARTGRLMLTAKEFDGDEALALGLADFAVDAAAGLETVEREIRADVLRCAPVANAVTKSLLDAATSLACEAFIDRAAGDFADCVLGDEGREGVAAFVERRAPSWQEDGQG